MEGPVWEAGSELRLCLKAPPNLAPRQLALGPLSSRPAQVTFTEENNRLDLREIWKVEVK